MEQRRRENLQKQLRREKNRAKKSIAAPKEPLPLVEEGYGLVDPQADDHPHRNSSIVRNRWKEALPNEEVEDHKKVPYQIGFLSPYYSIPDMLRIWYHISANKVWSKESRQHSGYRL